MYKKTHKACGPGRMIDLRDPKPEDIHLDDIAHALAAIPRWNGLCSPWYSVASHSLLVMQELVKNYPGRTCADAAVALLHDAHEAYTGDISTPMKEALRYDTDALDKIQHNLQMSVWAAFGLIETQFYNREGVPAMVKRCDEEAWKLESWALLEGDYEPEWRPTGPHHADEARVRVVPEERAEETFGSVARALLHRDCRTAPALPVVMAISENWG